jgi:antitoxin component YwqK of YwqJK toxin-antitoxin module
MRLPALICLLFALNIQGQELLEQTNWPDGTLRSTRISEGDRIHILTYHENGRLNEVGAYRNGMCDGVWKRYSDTGALILYARFEDGQRHGTWEFRSEDRPLGRLHFRNGSLAAGEQFNESGELIAYREY